MLDSSLEYELQVEVLAINVDRNAIAENDPLKVKMDSNLEKAGRLQKMALATRNVSLIFAFFMVLLSIVSAVSDAIGDRWKKL